jgi:hypothetical protein
MLVVISGLSADWVSAAVAIVSSAIAIVALGVSAAALRYSRRQAHAAEETVDVAEISVQVARNAQLDAERVATAAELDAVRQEQRAIDAERHICVLVGLEESSGRWEVRDHNRALLPDWGRKPFDMRDLNHHWMLIEVPLRGVVFNEDSRSILISSGRGVLRGGIANLVPTSLTAGGSLPPPVRFGERGEVLLRPGEALIFETKLGASVEQ